MPPTSTDSTPPIRCVYATPRALPKVTALGERVVVLDIAFASNAGGHSFASLTRPFIERLGARLVAWIDHHDSDHHADYAADPRFVLRRKAEHPACPELVTPERVAQAGAVDTLVCHGDFDGLVSAAKWMRGGIECYPGCDEDARAVDTRTGRPSEIARRLDRAIRGAPRDRQLPDRIVRVLMAGAPAAHPDWAEIDVAGAGCAQREAEAARLAQGYQAVAPDTVLVEVPEGNAPYDKTELLLLGQTQAVIAMVADGDTLTLAAGFYSGINFLQLLDLSGGMPTVVSVRRQQLAEVLAALAKRS